MEWQRDVMRERELERLRRSYCLPKPDGDAVDRYYAAELRRERYGSSRTAAQARYAWEVYDRPWKTEADIRRTNDLLAPFWLPYFYTNEVHGTMLRTLVRVVRSLAPERVLDAGCGVGFDCCFLARRFRSVAFRGTDLSPQMIAQANARASHGSLRNVAFCVAAHRALPDAFPSERFDFAYAHGTLFFYGEEDLRRHLNGIAGVLRPGGIFYCAMPMVVDQLAFVATVVGMDMGWSLWNDRGDIHTLLAHGVEVCWSCGFRYQP